MARGDLTDNEWVLVGALLPAERGRWFRPALDNRLFLNGMLYVLRAGCPYVRFRRCTEQGVWDALLETLVELRLTDDWQHMIDSTTVRGHFQAAGAKGWTHMGGARSRGGFTSKIHARADGQERIISDEDIMEATTKAASVGISADAFARWPSRSSSQRTWM